MGYVIWERELLQAQNPYYAELAGVSIYNLEELNYFLQKYFYLIDKRVFNENLVAFLHTEMNRPDLAKIVYGNVGKSHPVSIASKLIGGIDQMKESSSQRWREKAAEFQRLTPIRQKLLQADLLYQRKEFEEARTQYESILADAKERGDVLERDEMARACYHMSRIALESLSWKAAGVYLQEAFALTRDQDILKELYMLTCFSPEVICDGSVFRDVSAKTVRGWSQEFNRKKEEIEARKSLSYYNQLIREDEMGNTSAGAKALLAKWQEDFRKINKNSCQEMNSSV